MSKEKGLGILAIIAENPIEENYNDYFESKLYDKRFGDKKTTVSESKIIQKAFTLSEENIKEKWTEEFKQIAAKIINVAQQTTLPKFKLLDFGCGNGRLLPIILKIADDLASKGIELEVIGYDISKSGLYQYQEELENIGFGVDEAFQEKSGLDSCTLSKQNINFKLVHGSGKNIASEIGNVDATMCMFGVLSHMKGRENRQKILREIKEITSGYLAISIPGQNLFRKEKKAFDTLRNISDELEKGLEEGDIMYRVRGSGIEGSRKISNFYHLYTAEEFREDLEQSGFENFDIKSLSTLHPAELSKSRILECVDGFLVDVLETFANDYLKSKYSAYMGSVVEIPSNKTKSTKANNLKPQEQKDRK